MVASETFALTFCGGVQSVTGANFLFERSSGRPGKILVDCGLFQGGRVAEKQNYGQFPYQPAAVDALFVTHAHLDHIGRIPRLWRSGFRGKIYSTAPTKELAEVSLIDSLGVLTKEAKESGLPPLYQAEDVRGALSLWRTLEYGEEVAVGDFVVRLKNSGHILGSAIVEIDCAGRKISVTGDLGNSPMLLLPDFEAAAGADYLLMESVYGDRLHESRDRCRDELEDVIEETIGRRGTLLIPAFSIERTQELLYEIEKMMEESRIPLVPVFLDSPLAIQVTGIYKKYAGRLKIRGDIFRFPQLRQTLKTEDSRLIDHLVTPKIVIAGSGMSNGGRIIHHEKRYLPDHRSTLLLVGFQAASSLGRMLQDGERRVKILGEEVEVRARVVSLSGYSAHPDRDGLMDFVRRSEGPLKKVFVAMGEPHASFYLAQRLRDYLGVDAVVPRPGEVFKL